MTDQQSIDPANPDNGDKQSSAHQKAMSDPGASNHEEYQAIVQRLAFAAVNEQRRGRRWRIFFLFLTFLYLTPFLLISLDLNGLDFLQSDSKDSDKHTALVKLEGIIADGEQASARNINRSLRNAFKDKDTAAVVLEINSPGGSPVQAADIHDEILRLRDKYPDTPLYAVVSDIAASGGYFVAAAADQIFVNKSSLVGSIGVRMDGFGVVDLMEKMGVERRLLTAGENKALLDPFLPVNEQHQKHLQVMLDQVHQHFIDAVKQGRGERLKQNDELFSGLIWSGETAVDLGLVDDFGSSASIARDLVKQEDLVDFTSKEMLIDRLAERLGAGVASGLNLQQRNHLTIQ